MGGSKGICFSPNLYSGHPWDMTSVHINRVSPFQGLIVINSTVLL